MLYAKLTDKNIVPAPAVLITTKGQIINPAPEALRVAHNGKTWVSDIDNNVWEPGMYGWTEVT